MPNFKEWCFDKICCKCCIRRSRRDIAMQMAREKLDKEINIIEIVKSWRYYNIALKFLLTEHQ